MKKLILVFSTMLLMLGFTTIVKADETITFKVNGNAACKTQIEALVTGVQGVTSAVWDATAQKITIVFNSTTVNKDKFYVVLAEGGYDNEELHAKTSKYDALSAECKYTREAEKD